MSGTIEAHADVTPLRHPFAIVDVPESEQPSRPRGRRGRDGTSVRPRPDAVPRFNVADLIRRARRNAELSQREMADAIGVSKSTIARAEADVGTTSLPVLLAALAVGGLDLVVTDADGEAFPMRQDALRDRGGRKLPAHLEARVASASDCVPAHWSGSRRRNAPVRWHLRSRRRLMEALTWQHPGAEDVAIARRLDDDERAFRKVLLEARIHEARRRSPHEPGPLPCHCSRECVLRSTVCRPNCPCQCEATGDRLPDAPPSLDVPPSVTPQGTDQTSSSHPGTSRPHPLYLPRKTGQVQSQRGEGREGETDH